jgi:hypothetical protein
MISNSTRLKTNPGFFLNFYLTLCLGLFLLSAIVVSGANNCLAETFTWVDESGKLFYGTNPPKNAVGVEVLKTKKLSRYSSEQLLERLGWRASLKRDSVGNENPQSTKKETIENQIAADLEHSPVDIELSKEASLDKKKVKISNCSVIVHNMSKSAAKDISVAFEFSDGTLVPAAGPEKISSGKSAQYNIPESLLPLEIPVKENSSENPLTAQDSKPITAGVMPDVLLYGVTTQS